ncbi:MAG: hypothetical protein VB017_04075 [Endomicrobiaceae bacterium]|nr:hypothetical protein [Endomicrobiaceae bacterium]
MIKKASYRNLTKQIKQTFSITKNLFSKKLTKNNNQHQTDKKHK